MASDVPNPEELDWIRLRNELDQDVDPINGFEKGVQKMKENPFVPIGCMATVAALTYGIYSFSQGRSLMSQYMMRARVVCQGATLIAVVVGLVLATPKKK